MADSHYGKIVLAAICDGMGGLQKGEAASATVAAAIADWFLEELPKLLEERLTKESFRTQLTRLLIRENKKIREYGRAHNIRLGTCISALLIVKNRYYIVHVGDSRIYEIGDSLHLITKDQTVVQQELSLGKLTREEAKNDFRRHILLQCVGDTEELMPEFYYGTVREGIVFLLCSDGFYQRLSPKEIHISFHPSQIHTEQEMLKKGRYLIEQNKKKLEQDNISMTLIRTYGEHGVC